MPKPGRKRKAIRMFCRMLFQFSIHLILVWNVAQTMKWLRSEKKNYQSWIKAKQETNGTRHHLFFVVDYLLLLPIIFPMNLHFSFDIFLLISFFPLLLTIIFFFFFLPCRCSLQRLINSVIILISIALLNSKTKFTEITIILCCLHDPVLRFIFDFFPAILRA